MNLEVIFKSVIECDYSLIKHVEAGPSGKSQKKRPVAAASSSSDSATKYHSDEQTRGEAARGSIHGNRARTDDRRILATRPNHITQKQGTSGQQFKVKANYFPLISAMKWEVYLHHVEFTPEIEFPSFRNALLVRQRPTLGNFLFDRGSAIYTFHQLPNDPIEITTRDRDEREILIKIRRVGVISPLENRMTHVQNVIMKRAMKALNLQLVGRDHFDSDARVSVQILFFQFRQQFYLAIRLNSKFISPFVLSTGNR